MITDTSINTFAYFGGTQEWLIIGVIVLVLFGSTKIPQFAKGIGEGIREFKKSVDDSGDGTPPGPDKEEKEHSEGK